MLRIFRALRNRLLSQNRIGHYALYALGEILLVVLGILIAVQIDHWNENRRSAKKEMAYLLNLREDLTADSLRLGELKTTLTSAVRYKGVFERYLDGQDVTTDSVNALFTGQYYILTDFIPNTTTLDELTSSEGLNLISDKLLRRQIVTLYNTYEDLVQKLELGQEKSQKILEYVSRQVTNIDHPTREEVHELLEDRYFVNQTRVNYLLTQLYVTTKAHTQCVDLLRQVRNQIQDGQDL